MELEDPLEPDSGSARDGSDAHPSSEAHPGPASTGQVQHLDKQQVAAIVRGGALVAVCGLAQLVIPLLPGADIALGRATLGGWVKMALAVVILVVLLRLLAPLRTAASYYVGLVFRASERLADRQALRETVSSAGIYVVLLVYLAALYQAVLPPLFNLLLILIPGAGTLVLLVKLGFAVGAIVLIVKLVMVLKPLFGRLTDAMTDRAVELTEKADSVACPSCGARAPRGAQFCQSCGAKL